jgi:hypothetical protein
MLQMVMDGFVMIAMIRTVQSEKQMLIDHYDSRSVPLH